MNLYNGLAGMTKGLYLYICVVACHFVYVTSKRCIEKMS